MLNEENDCTDNAAVGDDIYCVVTEENWSDPDDDIVELDGIVDDTENSEHLGQLILEGEEYNGGDDEEYGEAEEENRRRNESVSLSIPETLFLPSEVRSMEASGVTNEQDKNNRVKGVNSTGNILAKLGSGQPSCSSRLQAGRYGPFNMAHITVIIAISVTLLSYESWRTRVWKNEAHRLMGELEKQNSLLPFTLSLLKEREALLEKQGQLEEVVERAMRRASSASSSESMFAPEPSDDDKILSIKTCYVEASLSLGRCSKEWQNWWSDTSNGSNGRDTADESYDEGFTTDLSKLVKSFTKSLAATTTQSYMFVEKAVKELSYDGIKDALYRDEWPDDTASNDTVDNKPRYPNRASLGRIDDAKEEEVAATGFQKVLSKLINGCEGSADEVTSKVSLWNW